MHFSNRHLSDDYRDQTMPLALPHPIGPTISFLLHLPRSKCLSPSYSLLAAEDSTLLVRRGGSEGPTENRSAGQKKN